MSKFLWFKWLVRRLLCLPLLLFRQTDGIRILMYHRVTDQVQTELAVAPKSFRQQMEYLAQHEQVISMTAAVRLLGQNKKISGSYIVLTFDDGYEDIYHTVFPVLASLQLPATVFLPVSYISSQQMFWWDAEVGHSDTLRLEQILAMQQTGLLDFQSHSIYHYDLNKVDRLTMAAEIGSSRQQLTHLLGREVRYFAYPRGIFTPPAVELVKKHYQAAVCSIIGTNNASGDLHLLKRIPIDRSDDLTIYKYKVKGKFELLYTLRKFRVLALLWEKIKKTLTGN